jgi:hypothetical protein
MHLWWRRVKYILYCFKCFNPVQYFSFLHKIFEQSKYVSSTSFERGNFFDLFFFSRSCFESYPIVNLACGKPADWGATHALTNQGSWNSGTLWKHLTISSCARSQVASWVTTLRRKFGYNSHPTAVVLTIHFRS